MPTTVCFDPARPGDMERAAELLRRGGTVAFPTETVYGLGANALDSAAVAGIFAAKRRPSWDPLIVHIAELLQLEAITEISTDLRVRVDMLAKACWPGPLTLLLPRSAAIPDAVTAGRRLVGVRIPAHPVALELLRLAGLPIAAPSANSFGHTSPTTAAHVLADLDGRIDAVVDGGPTAVGVESTVLDPAAMVVYRPGAVTVERIAAICGVAVARYTPPIAETPVESLPSPGVGIRHYAPRARVVLVEGTEAALRASLQQHARGTGVLLPDGWCADISSLAAAYRWGHWDRPEELAARLFAGLRQLDDTGAHTILVPQPPTGGLGDAIRDRLQKASFGAVSSE